jgi:putative membrane protein
MHGTIVRRTADIMAICIIAISFVLCGKRTISENIGTGVLGRDSLVNTNDANFMRSAAELNLEEIRLGKLARVYATMPEVKEMARLMENDYTNTLYQLQDIANRKLLTLPAEMNSDGKESYEKLVSINRNDFDKQFISMLVGIDNNAIDMFEKEADDTHDTDIKEWVTSVITVIKDQLTKAQMCEEQCKR